MVSAQATRARSACATAEALRRSCVSDTAIDVDAQAYYPGEALLAFGPTGAGAQVAQKIYAEHCASCHGAAGQGDAATFVPMVAAQHYRYLLRELVHIGDGSRGNSQAEIVKVVKPYSQVELEAVADHMSRLPPPAP